MNQPLDYEMRNYDVNKEVDEAGFMYTTPEKANHNASNKELVDESTADKSSRFFSEQRN